MYFIQLLYKDGENMQQLIKQKQNLVNQLLKYGNLVKGSINATCVNCNRATCICKSKTNKKAFRLTYKDKNQKTVIVYVPKERLKEIRLMISNYARFRKILDRLIYLNIESFRSACLAS